MGTEAVEPALATAPKNGPDTDSSKKKADPAAIAAAYAAAKDALLALEPKLKSRKQLCAALPEVANLLAKIVAVANAGRTKDEAEQLDALLTAIAEHLFALDTSLGTDKNPARRTLVALYEQIETKLELKDEPPYNPLNVAELTKSIEDAFSKNKPIPLADVKPFRGSGVYALYYKGNFELYKPIAESNKGADGSWAIYVGKAGNEGKRKGIDFGKEGSSKFAIYQRLADQHAESIKQTANLNIKDFSVRYLPIEGLFVPLCEKMLIAQHKPLWNLLVDGFGNKHMGEARIDAEKGQQVTKWDLLHPGRADRASKPNKRFPQRELLEQKVREFLQKAKDTRPTFSEAIEQVVAETENS